MAELVGAEHIGREHVTATVTHTEIHIDPNRHHDAERIRIAHAESRRGAWRSRRTEAKLDDPIADSARIKAALAANMLVRTRADADTVQARADDTRTRDAALPGGAQFVSRDDEVRDRRFGPYVVRMPGGTPARCNPVTAPPGCRSTDVEHPSLLG